MINREVIQNINKHTEDIKNLGSSLETIANKKLYKIEKNLVELGLKCDGVTDDTVKLQEAFNKALQEGLIYYYLTVFA